MATEEQAGAAAGDGAQGGALRGRHALVTGGSSGIGPATGIRLASDGARITICDRTEDKLASAVEAIRAVGAAADMVADLTTEEEVATAAERRLDILFACAGGSFRRGRSPRRRPRRFARRSSSTRSTPSSASSTGSARRGPG
jgi:NAD(P)-dependent dehydrogenase (short-subunit alcohol dehydrogenase family)